MAKIEFGKPIKVFYANLLAIGVEVNLDEATGRLIVDGNLDCLSPIYREEIVKRAKHLQALLRAAPPTELAPYFGRLLHLAELYSALYLAETLGAMVDALPVNGGWLLTMAVSAIGAEQAVSAPMADTAKETKP